MSTLTRRTFLNAAAATTLGIVASPFAHAADAYGGLRMGMQSYTYRSFSLPDFLKKVASLDLHHVELFPGHLDHNKATKAELTDAKKMMDDLDISMDAYGVTGFNTDEAAARKVFEFGKFMGIRSISADPKQDSFDMLDKLVEEYDIPIAIHNHGPNHHWGKPEVILEAVKDHHKLIGLCADTGHFLRAGVDPVKAIKILKGRVFGLHVKDFISEHKEVVAGDGKLDLKALIKEVQSQNFDGACSIEFELDPKDPTAGVQKGLSNIREAVSSLS